MFHSGLLTTIFEIQFYKHISSSSSTLYMLFHLYATSLTPLIKPLQTTKQLVSRYVRASPSPCPPHSAGALSFQPGSGPVTRQHFKLRLGGIRPACEIETSCVLMFIHNPKAVGVERLLLFVLNMGTTQ